MNPEQIDYLTRARHFEGPIQRLADHNPLVHAIIEHYARGQIVTKEEALSQMVVQLGQACSTTQAQYVDLIRRSCLPPVILPAEGRSMREERR